MSSLTISTTVWVDCQPCSSIVGLKTRSFAVPGGRRRAKLQCESAMPYRSSGKALGEVLRIDLAKVLAHEALERRLLALRDLRANERHHLLDPLMRRLVRVPLHDASARRSSARRRSSCSDEPVTPYTTGASVF